MNQDGYAGIPCKDDCSSRLRKAFRLNVEHLTFCRSAGSSFGPFSKVQSL